MHSLRTFSIHLPVILYHPARLDFDSHLIFVFTDPRRLPTRDVSHCQIIVKIFLNVMYSRWHLQFLCLSLWAPFTRLTVTIDSDLA